MAEETLRSLQSSTEMVKADITLLTIQCRGLAGDLFTKLSRENGNPVATYNNFICLFYQLYQVFKYNACQLPSIKDWDKKQKIFDDFFNNEILKDKRYSPEKALGYFDQLLSDIVRAGIYNLATGEIFGKGDFK